MIDTLLGVVSLVLLIGLIAYIVIGVHRAAPPNPDRTEERRQMREERRRPGKEKE